MQTRSSLPAVAGLLFCVLLTIVIAVSAGPVGRSLDARTSTVSYQAASSCCQGCSYQSGCCCAARDKLPLTKTKIVKTKTVIVHKTVTASKKAARGLSLAEGQPQEPTDVIEGLTNAVDANTEEAEFQLSVDLFARHTCPRCPAGVVVAAAGAKNHGNNNPTYCCPPRKTVTVKKTSTKKVTKTITQAPRATIIGRVYYDNDKNNVFSQPPDTPIGNTVIVLVYSASKGRSVVDVLGKTKTDTGGNFVMTFDKQSPGVSLNVVKDSERYQPLLSFVTNAQGGADVDVPILRPKDPLVITPAVVKGNVITVVGGNGNSTLTPTAYLYADGVLIGQGSVGNDGSFTLVATKKVRSGPHAVSITLADHRNAESKPISAGTVHVIDPPTWSSTILKVNVAEIKGLGKAGAKLDIYDETNTFVGSAVVDNAGSWTVLTTGLAIGKHNFTATQTDDSGVSDSVPAGQVEVKVPLPAGSVVTKTSLDQETAIATVEGTGVAGATIKLYADGLFAGTAVVDNAGKFVVSTPALAVGTHTLAVTQTVSNGATSDAVPADNVTVLAKSVTTTVLPKPLGSSSTVPAQAGTTVPAQATTAAATASQTRVSTTEVVAALTTTALGPTTTSQTATPTATVCEKNIRVAGVGGYFDSYGMAADSQGNTIIAGWFTSSFTIDNVTVSPNGATNTAVIKFNYKLDVIWVKVIADNIWSGSNTVASREVSVDSNDDILIGGNFACNSGAGCLINGQNTTSNGAWTIKLTSCGNSVWLATWRGGGAGSETVAGLAVGPDNTVYASGYMAPGTYSWSGGSVTNPDGSRGLVIFAYNGTTGNVIWGTYPGSGAGVISPEALALYNGRLYVGGSYAGTRTINGTVYTSSSGSEDNLVLAFRASDGGLVWLNTFGGTHYDRVFAIEADATGVYCASGSYALDGTVAGSCFVGSDSQDKNWFIYKLDLSDGQPVWAKRFNGDYDDEPRGSTLTPDGGFVVGGYVLSTFLDFGSGLNWTNPAPGEEGAIGGLIVKFDKATGTTLAAAVVGGTHEEDSTWIYDFAITSDNKLRAVAEFREPDWTIDSCNIFNQGGTTAALVIGMEYDLQWQTKPN